MKTVTVGRVVFGEGRMKICVPVCAKTEAEALHMLEKIRETPADLVEWRVDYFEADAAEALPRIRKAAGALPVLCTFRTKAEGGERDLLPGAYFALLEALLAGGAPFLDVELALFEAEPARAEALLRALHEKNGAAVISHHNFRETPPRREMVELFRRMRETGGDLPKLAVMPQTQRDVMALLSAMAEAAAEGPLVGIAMGDLGKMTRVRGGAFGSVMTFGCCEKASAPGQIDAETLAKLLK